MSSAFVGQRIAIIGGTAGIGAAIAREAAARGANVVVAGRRGEFAEGPGQIEARQIDIALEKSIRDFFSQLGYIDHLVVTASFVAPGSFKAAVVEEARISFEGKFWSQYLCARYADVRRSILHFSGIYSRKPPAGVSSIAAANGAIESLGRALAVELAPVRVNVISSGLIQGTEAYDGISASARDEMFAAAAQRLPVGIVGDPQSVAGPALALLASPYVTGVALNVDGGGLVT